MNKLKNIAILIAAAAALGLAGCGSEADVKVPETLPYEADSASETGETQETEEPETTVEETTQESHEGQKKSYLTGLWEDEEKVNRRPVSIMLSNIKQAIPQTGISMASVIYEAPVEGMITRLMGVFEDYDGLEKIGSVRSARTYFVFWSEQWDSVYAHYGQCDYANIYLDQIDNLNGVKGSGNGVYYRTTDRKAPHNAYTSEEGLAYGIQRMGYRTEHEADYDRGVFLFADQPGDVTLENGSPASYVYPGYRTNTAYFEYDEESQKYLRFEFDQKQIDDMTGEQLAVDNIIIQYCTWEYYYKTTPYLWIDIWSSGEGYYITQGKAIPITWKGGVEYEPTTYYDADGNELEINPGKTWVCTVLTENKKDTVIE